MAGDGPNFLSADVDLILFGGKGGVGKTTCAAATALARARGTGGGEGERVRLMSTDPAHSVEDRLAGAPRPDSLVVEEFDAGEALEDFRDAHRSTLHEIVSRGTLFDEEDVQRLLDLALPGMDEVMAFLRLADKAAGGDGELLIVDTAPTGHTLRLLETPGQFARWIGFLDTMLEKHRYMRSVFAGSREPDAYDRFVDDMRSRTDRVRDLLRDPDRCRFVVVTQAEPIVLTETRRLLGTLQERSVPVTEGVVNRWDRRTVSASDARASLYEDESPDWWTLPDAGGAVRGDEGLADLWTRARRLSEAASETGDEPETAPGLPTVDTPIACPDARLLLVAGKGGVGKTTTACATALYRAGRLVEEGSDRKVLLASTDPAHSLSAALERDVSDEPARVADGLEAVEVDAAARFERLRDAYVDEVRAFFRSAGGEGLDFTYDRPVAEGLMDLAPPGVDEVMGWTAVMEFLQDDRYDTCVLDTAPTGHFVRLLEMPGVFETWIRTFFRILRKHRSVLRLPELTDRLVRLSKQVKAFRSLVESGDGAILGVTLPEELARAEMDDLRRAAREHGVRLPAVVVNRTAPPGAPARRQREEADVLASYRTAFSDAGLATVTEARSPLGVGALRTLGERLYTSSR